MTVSVSAQVDDEAVKPKAPAVQLARFDNWHGCTEVKAA